MENVVVTVQGTALETKTNFYGEYTLTNVPAGEVTVSARYVGEPTQNKPVTVTASDTAVRDFTFREDAVAPAQRKQDGTVTLDPFVVSTQRYANAQAIAIAAERNSVNIKNVVSIDAFGNIPSGNVGEFVKFLPGVQIDYGASNGNGQGYSENDANGVSVRGFGPEDTAILIDGMPVAATLPGNLTRQVGLDQLSINNAARVELIKVATPDMPANSMGGQINLITKSAFEYARPTYNASLFFNINSLKADLDKSPGPTNKETFKTTPGASFSASYPFSKTMGISVTGYWSQNFNQNYRAALAWNNNHANNYDVTGAFTNTAGQKSSTANEVLSRYTITDSPSLTEKTSGNIKFDWRPTNNQLLRANVQFSTYDDVEAQRRLDFRPLIGATGVEWDSTHMVASPGNGTTDSTVTTRDRTGETVNGQLQYSLNVAGFAIAVAGSASKSESDFIDEQNGHFSAIDMSLAPGTVALYYGEDGIPNRVATFARGTNQPLDYTQLSNWTIANTRAQSGETHNETLVTLYKIDVERPLDFLPFLGSNSLSLKAGYRHDQEDNEKSGRGTGYQQIVRPGSVYNPADIVDSSYLGQSPGFGLPAQQWASTYKLFQLNKEKNLFYVPDFDEATNTRVTNYNSFVGQQKELTEKTDAWYAMLSGNFFKNRFLFVGGLRQESKQRVGRTPFTDNKWMYVKNKDGSLYTDAAHLNGVRFDQTGSDVFAQTAAGSALRSALTSSGLFFPTSVYGPASGNGLTWDLRSRMLNYQPLRPVNQKVTGDPTYSINTVYRITSKIDLKVAYSRSFKLQNLESGANGGVVSGTANFQVEEFSADQVNSNNGALGRIIVANPALKPETAQNWDFDLSFYSDNGGRFGIAYYIKDVTNQNQTFTTYSGSEEFDQIMAALALDPVEYDLWRVETSANSLTKQKTTGWEFSVTQDFRFLGKWGRSVSAFATWSMRDFPPPAQVEPYTITNPNGTTTQLTPAVNRIVLRADRSGSFGLQYSARKFTAQLRGTYRNENQEGSSIALSNGNVVRKMSPAETRVDVNFSYLINKNYSVYVSARDVFNGERDQEWVDERGEIPDYARLADRKKFGTVWTVGFNGTW